MDSKHTDKFNANDFLLNKKFIEWRLFRTQEMDDYWQNYLSLNPESREEIEIAIEKFKAIKINDYKLSTIKKEDLLAEILDKSAIKVRRHYLIRYYWAAAVACVLILSLILPRFMSNKDQPVLAGSIVGNMLPAEDIKLISGSKTVSIKQNSQIKILHNGTVELTQADQQETSAVALEEEINTLMVPYGKQTSLTLSDGTKIWVNSGTRLEFPTRFKKDTRNINVNGEIYLDVAHNPEKPFYVHSDKFSVKVYGTKFNVSAYNGSDENSVVLVEGKVEVQTPSRSQIIKPGELYAMQGERVKYEKVDVNEYVSWVDGVFYFNHASISQILKKVGRYYNVEFNESQSGLSQRTCTGQLYLSSDIDQVLSVICTLSNTNYRKSGSKIYITTN